MLKLYSCFKTHCQHGFWQNQNKKRHPFCQANLKLPPFFSACVHAIPRMKVPPRECFFPTWRRGVSFQWVGKCNVDLYFVKSSNITTTMPVPWLKLRCLEPSWLLCRFMKLLFCTFDRVVCCINTNMWGMSRLVSRILMGILGFSSHLNTRCDLCTPYWNRLCILSQSLSCFSSALH